MLFHIRQHHEPADCPYGKGGSRSLFDESAPGVKDPAKLRAFFRALAPDGQLPGDSEEQ